jgi:hypothetical protein
VQLVLIWFGTASAHLVQRFQRHVCLRSENFGTPLGKPCLWLFGFCLIDFDFFDFF